MTEGNKQLNDALSTQLIKQHRVQNVMLHDKRGHHIRRYIQPFYSHYVGHPLLTSTQSLKLTDFVWSKVSLLYAIADSNQCIWIMEMLMYNISTC